mmetsp:Transcript_38283/g.123141  ORF Transcript_38283/g.123141 Transcript_38283/m.123141 type:complete len:764 (+) Transcript_38283:46-2337(+)
MDDQSDGVVPEVEPASPRKFNLQKSAPGILAGRSAGAFVRDASGALARNASSRAVGPFQGSGHLDMEYPRSAGEQEKQRPSHNFNVMMAGYGFTMSQVTYDPSSELHSVLMERKGLRGFCCRICSRTIFQWLCTSVIILNLVIITLAAEDQVKLLQSPGHADALARLGWLGEVDTVCQVYFILEITIRTLGCPRQPWKDYWLVFDGVIVLLSILDTWIVGPLSGSDGGSDSPVLLLRALRIIRAFRTVRLLRFVRSLRVLAEAMADAVRSVLCIILVFAIFSVACAVVFTFVLGTLPPLSKEQLGLWGAEDDESDVSISDMFSSVGASTLTLNVMVLHGFHWGTRLMVPLLFSGSSQHVVGGLALLVYLIFSMTFLLKVMSGNFIGSIIEAYASVDAAIRRQWIAEGHDSLEKFRSVCDASGEGLLSWDMLHSVMLGHPELKTNLNISEEQLFDLFRSIDVSAEDLVDIDEFIMGILKKTRLTPKIDMLSMDLQQQKTNTRLRLLRESYARDIASVMAAVERICKGYNGLFDSLKQLSKDVAQGFFQVSLLQPPPHSPEFGGAAAAATDEGAEVQAAPAVPSSGSNAPAEKAVHARSPKEEVMHELDSSYDFQRRLLAVEAALRSAELGASGGGGGDGDGDADSAFWRGLLCEEVLPWLRWQLAMLPSPAPTQAGASKEAQLQDTAAPEEARLEETVATEEAQLEVHAPMGKADGPSAAAEKDRTATPRRPLGSGLALSTLKTIDAASPWSHAKRGTSTRTQL